MIRRPLDTPSAPAALASHQPADPPSPFATGPAWWAACGLMALAALFIAISAAFRDGGSPPAPVRAATLPAQDPPADSRLDLNSATAAQLELLPRVGPALARRIVEYREAHGPFTSVAQLDNVQGIGPRTLELLTPHLRVAPPSPEAPVR